MFGLNILFSSTTRLKTHYWPLIKFRQTFLLTLTGVAGFISRSSLLNWVSISGLIGSLLLTISGSTVLNMVFDRDLDRKMERTSRRPLVTGQVKPGTAAILGITLIALGLIWALTLSWLYCLLILSGVVLDVLVYTLWLKRRSPWSILWGGFSGGMPILAGSALAFGRVDKIGLLLCLAIVSWIPSHNLTLGTLYSADYRKAGVPSFSNVYGIKATHIVVAFSSLITIFIMLVAFSFLNYPVWVLTILVVSGFGLVGVASYVCVHPSRQVVTVLYKYSSIFMLFVVLLLTLVCEK